MEKASMKTVSELLHRVPPLFLDLSKVLAGEIDCSRDVLEKYSIDGSPYQVLPQAVIYPKNITDIKHVLSFAREYSMPVSVRGCGNGKQGGALSEGIVIDMTRYFNAIRQISMTDNLVTVDAGVRIKDILPRLDGWGFELPPLLKTEEETTLGALFATRSVSPSTFFHGSIREWVESLTIVVDNGEEHKIADGVTPSGRLLGIYQTIFPLLNEHSAQLRAAKPTSGEDATGYSLWSTSIGPRQLIEQLSGSEGTLSIITSITLRLAPKKYHSEAMFIPLTKEELLHAITIAKEHKAESLFLYDETFKHLVERYHSGLLPILPETPYVLVAIHKDNDRMRLRDTVRAFKEELPIPEHLVHTDSSDEKALRIMSRDFLHDLIATYSKGTLVPTTSTEGCIVRPSDVVPCIENILSSLHVDGKITIITGCVGSGHIAVTSLIDPYAQSYESDLKKHQETVFSVIKKYKGGISASSGEGLAKTPYITYCYNDTTTAIFEKIKKAWDPLSFLNPGKKIYIQPNYLTKHLRAPQQLFTRP